MTNEETNKALDSVQKHLQSMLDKLESIKAEQEEDLKTASGATIQQTELSLLQTKALIEEITNSKLNLEAMLKRMASGKREQ